MEPSSLLVLVFQPHPARKRSTLKELLSLPGESMRTFT
jgi:hypothetical protein